MELSSHAQAIILPLSSSSLCRASVAKSLTSLTVWTATGRSTTSRYEFSTLFDCKVRQSSCSGLTPAPSTTTVTAQSTITPSSLMTHVSSSYTRSNHSTVSGLGINSILAYFPWNHIVIYSPWPLFFTPVQFNAMQSNRSAKNSAFIEIVKIILCSLVQHQLNNNKHKKTNEVATECNYMVLRFYKISGKLY